MSTGAVNFEQPVLFVSNEVQTQIRTDGNDDSIQTARMIVRITFPVTIFLDTLVNEYQRGRTDADDRLAIYSAVEDRIENYGLNGQSCLLRFTCEIHRFRLEHRSLFGQLLTAVFSPGVTSHQKLQFYHMAEKIGRKGGKGACKPYYYSCPISLFAYLILLREDKDAWNVDPEILFDHPYSSEFSHSFYQKDRPAVNLNYSSLSATDNRPPRPNMLVYKNPKVSYFSPFVPISPPTVTPSISLDYIRQRKSGNINTPAIVEGYSSVIRVNSPHENIQTLSSSKKNYHIKKYGNRNSIRLQKTLKP